MRALRALMTPTMVSYGKNAADVVLARAFEDQAAGFYVDVGASHPDHESVTKRFYDRGWCGINVAPLPADYALLCEARPRDMNLRLALSDWVGRGRMYQADEKDGERKLRGDVAPCFHESSAAVGELDVELATLADVCARHAPGPIDFLRIDVDGHEAQVIGGGDWARCRPRVVLVAVTAPGSTVSSHAAWEPVLLAAGYQLALFDGVNRFYVRAEDAALMPRLAVPANAHDTWEPRQYVSKITEMERYVAALQAELAERGRYAVDVQEHFERCLAWVNVLEGKVRSCEEHLSKIVEMERYVTALEAQLAERGRYAADVQEHFERCQAWVNVLESKVRCFEEHLGLLPGTLPPPRPG